MGVLNDRGRAFLTLLGKEGVLGGRYPVFEGVDALLCGVHNPLTSGNP